MDLLFFLHQPWWMYIIEYLASVWLVSTACMRFAPRHCPKYELVVPDRYSYDRNGQVHKNRQSPVRERISDRHCRKRVTHVHHVWLRENSAGVGILWPIALVIAIPALFVVLYICSMAAVGHADWWSQAKENKQRELS